MFGKYQILKIDEFLAEHAAGRDELVDYIRDRQEQLVCQYGYRKICDIEDACRMHENSEDEIAARKAVDKLNQKEIFEICARVSFLAGICTTYQWFENNSARSWPFIMILKANQVKNPYQRQNVHCEICDETQYGTVVFTTPPLHICDVCLTMMDRAVAMEVIGDEDRQSTKSPDPYCQDPARTDR